jgi:hypothetical protein
MNAKQNKSTLIQIRDLIQTTLQEYETLDWETVCSLLPTLWEEIIRKIPSERVHQWSLHPNVAEDGKLLFVVTTKDWGWFDVGTWQSGEEKLIFFTNQLEIHALKDPLAIMRLFLGVAWGLLTNQRVTEETLEQPIPAYLEPSGYAAAEAFYNLPQTFTYLEDSKSAQLLSTIEFRIGNAVYLYQPTSVEKWLAGEIATIFHRTTLRGVTQIPVIVENETFSNIRLEVEPSEEAGIPERIVLGRKDWKVFLPGSWRPYQKRA